MSKNTRTHRGFVLAALSIQIVDRTGKEIQLTPAGHFRAVDGRPGSMVGVEVQDWVIEAEDASKLIAAANARKNRSVLDYEHQTLLKEQNGQPAPAAGWFKNLEWREGVGLFATDVQWTPRASEMLASEEYQYISPVILFNPKTGRVTGLPMAALTNHAGIDGMQPAALAALADLALSFNEPDDEEPPMNKLLATLFAALNLPEKATEDEAITALNAHLDKTKKETEQVADLSSKLAAAGNPDPSKFVPIETVTSMQQQMATLSAQFNGRQVDEVVQAALSAGKLMPAQEAWARELGKKDLAALQTFVKDAPQIAALTNLQSGGKQPERKDGELTADEVAMCTSLGISAEDYKKNMAPAV